MPFGVAAPTLQFFAPRGRGRESSDSPSEMGDSKNDTSGIRGAPGDSGANADENRTTGDGDARAK